MKMILLRGLPASGKSSKAKEIVDCGGNFVRINRDLLREMLHFNRWTRYNEQTTINIAEVMVRNLIITGHNVVIDDTNLGVKHVDKWKNMAKMLDAKFEVIDMDVHYTECIKRDEKRENPVGEHVIRAMALQYKMLDIHGPIVVCDMDGTLADCKHRTHFVTGETKDWAAFFEGIPDDKPRTEVFDILKEYYDKGADIVIVSARPERYRGMTKRWLEKHIGNMRIKALIMRGDHDKRPDTEVKESIYNTYLKQYDIEAVIDDRPSVVRMWRALGLKVVDVGDGIEF